MKKLLLLISICLTVAACASQPPVPTNTPLPPFDTPTPFVVPTNTPIITNETATTQPTQATQFVPTSTDLPQVATSTSLPPVTGVFNPYAVILVNKGDVLNIRSAAGIGQSVVGSLAPNAINVNRTGPATSAGGDRWVEIQNPSGGVGWVNAKFLTEYTAPSAFCSDSRVADLLNNVRTAMLNSNGELLGSLVSPEHGLDLRLWRWGTVANYTPEEAAWVFNSDYVVKWGPAPGSGMDTNGTFSQQILPKLQEVFSANYTLNCNNTLDLATFSTEPWLSEYANVNFYTIFKPGSEQYGGLDWRAWIAGVEYVQGKPMLFALIHFQWEP
ncbi:MAG: SH3 domain-containing protein [Anaerolineales bacterium]|nr:SH3 domain-containing protein [Anaerolineales bacterium]